MIASLTSSFRNSMRGLSIAARGERAVRQELAVLAVAVPAATFVADSIPGWVTLVGVVVIVLAIELLNTAIEKLCDHLHPARHPAIGTVKDLGSAAVFCSIALGILVWGAALALALGRWLSA